jgi:hypothetical protein
MKTMMKTKFPWLVWIDHRRAILLHTDAEGHILTEEMLSQLGDRERYNGEGSDKTGLFGQSVNRQKSDQAHENHQFQAFLKTVVHTFRDVDSIRILGPGDARFELQNLIEKDKTLQGIPVTTEAADKMTMPMLKAALLE